MITRKLAFTRSTAFAAAALFLGFLSGCDSAVQPPDAQDFVTVSNPASPRVAYALSRTKQSLALTVEVTSYAAAGGDISLQVGVAADKAVTLSGKDATTETKNGVTRYNFKIPNAKLVNDANDWTKLRLAMAVEWAGGPNGTPRQREAFLQIPGRAPHDGLSANSADWLPLDLAEFERATADRHHQIAFDFNQPMDGKYTIVIEDAQGNRVRNLVSGQSLAKGEHRIVWNGLDDSGNVVLPGEYNWRAISHPGLGLEYLMSYCDGPGSNHGTFQAAATNGSLIFLGSPVSEGGYQVVMLNPDGTYVRGTNAPLGVGLQAIRLAADDKFVYAAYDGMFWGETADREKPDWKSDRKIDLVRFEIATGNPTDFPTARFVPLRKYDVGPGSDSKRADITFLAGLALLNGHLYVADRIANEVQEVDPATAAVTRAFPLANPTALAAGNGLLYAIADGQLVKIDPANGQAQPIVPLAFKAGGLTLGSDGRFFVSDDAAQVVRILDANGAEVGMIGKPGGVVPGPYDPLKFKNPAGLVQGPNGWVWVTENERWQPKRVAAFDPANGNVMKESFGPTAYGAPGASFDPANPTNWIGLNTMFDVSLAQKTATAKSIMGGETGMHYRFWRQDGRTFLISYDKATFIQELLPNGTLKPLAFSSTAHLFSFYRNWHPESGFVEAFQKAYPNEKYIPGTYGRPNHGFGMLWVDKNGNGTMEADEFDFSTDAESYAGSGWGNDFYDLTLRLPALVKGRGGVLVELKPDGWWPGGAPKYPSLNDAIKAAPSIDLPENTTGRETTVDQFKTTILNSSPMRAFAPDGKTKWSFPNQFMGVHGSQKAPLPTSGEFQGILFFTGVAPFDDKADVMAMNNNHGRLYFMTSDGFYLDELFSDVRLTSTQDFTDLNILGGECFGGSFGKSEKDGNYYFQGGGIQYRIYQIDGLKDAVRSAGKVSVTAEQAVASERSAVRTLGEKAPPKVTIAWRDTPPTIDGKEDDWTGEPTIKWNQTEGRFPIAIRAAYDSQNLYLSYTVGDDSPWVNNGTDWQTLFKTGDGVDLQIGTDASANPTRSGPVPGDMRLFVAPFQGSNLAVLYRHRLPGATDGAVFQSPWRSEKVDSVKKLDNVQTAVVKEGNQYRVEMAIPLTDLGVESLAGKTLRTDFGVIYGDGAGKVNILRNYWANPATGLVNDVPGEIMLTPNVWGDAIFEEKK